MRACFFLFVTLVHIFLRGCKIKGSGLIRNRGEAGGEDGAVRNTNQTLFPLYRCWLDASPNTDQPLNKNGQDDAASVKEEKRFCTELNQVLTKNVKIYLFHLYRVLN